MRNSKSEARNSKESPGRASRVLATRTGAALLLFFILISSGLLFGKTNYKKWLNQEVVWIISKAERETFQDLRSDEAREEFIERFWRRRDPTPSTEHNEYREEHYRRLIFANKMFQEGIPGWKTDRGHIYILHGPPDSEYFFNSRSVMSPERTLPSTAQSPNTIVWVYHQNKNAKFYRGEVHVIFQPSTGLNRQSFALSDSKAAQDRADELSRHFFPASNPNWLEGDVRYRLVMAGPPGVINSKGADLPTTGLGEFSHYLEDLLRSPGELLEEREASAKELSEAVGGLRNATTTEISFGDLPFELTTQALHQPSGNWLLSLEIAVPPEVKGSDFQLYAVLLKDADGQVLDEFIDTFWREEAEGGGAGPASSYFNSFLVPSGRFRVRVALREMKRKATGYRETTLDLEPMTSEGLELGMVLLTNRVEILPQRADNGEEAPPDDHSIVYQNVRLLPSSSHIFATGSPLFLFLQVWVKNPEATITMNANFIHDGQIVGRLEPRRIETEGQRFANHGTIVPLSGLEPGDYTLQLQVIEHDSKKFEIRRLPLTLVVPPGGQESGS